MENEQISSIDINQENVKMPIKKVFTILGLGISLSVVLLCVAQGVLAYLFKKYMPSALESDFFIFGISTIPLALVAMPVLFAVTSFIPTIKTNYKSKLSAKSLGKIFLISYPAMIILSSISRLINIIISQITGTSVVNPLDFIQNTSIWPTLLFAVIISPIIEEIMFRYIIINKLRGYGSGVAIFTSAFTFGLYHGNLFQMLYAFALGAVFAAIVYKTGKLRYSIILHIAINFVGSIFPVGMMSANPIIAAFCNVLLVAIGLTGFIMGIVMLCKTKFYKFKCDLMPKHYVKPFFLNIGMILFIVIIASMVVISFIK